ncbi:MAG: glycosyltransferase family 39 protein, partial [Chloroflexota bacterium]
MTIALTRPTQLPVSILRWVELIAWPLILGLALWLRLENIGIYTGSFDEGIRSEQMLLMAAGFRPFREIFASQGPLLLDLLFPFYLLFGQSLEAIRLGVVVMSVVALLGAGWTARLVAGPMAGIATLALLSVSPAFLESSRLALAETPSLAPSIWAIAAALRFQQSGLMRWAAAAGVLLAVGVLVKPMVVPVIATVGLLVLLRMPASSRGIGFIIVAAGGVSCLVVLALGPSGVYDDLAAYRGGASHKLGSDAAENFRLIS